MKLERKSDHIKILETESPALTVLDKGVVCLHCKERYYLITKAGDNNNLFCTECGGLTPLRTIKHNRGISAPSIQQDTAIIQSKLDKVNRSPKGINKQKKDPLEERLISQGRTIINSDYNEPVPV